MGKLTAGPEIKSTNYEINAYITADKSTEGVIYALGEHMGGQVLFIKDGKLRYSYSTLGLVENIYFSILK